MIELCDSQSCTGCGACYNACHHDAISLSPDIEGFLRPVIDTKKCIGCGLCQKACPILNCSVRDRVPFHLYGAWNNDDEIVKQSSSGGLFSLIANEILDKNGVVFGAAYDEQLNVRHIGVENKADLFKLRSSKYIQSDINDTYRQVFSFLRKGRFVLFTGTPCQIAGLYGCLGNRNSENLFTCDLLCHGAPSPMIFQEYKKWLEKKHNANMISYVFRDKHWGWNGWCLKATFDNGVVYYGKNHEDAYFQAFIREYIMRPSCYDCHFVGTKRFGDITLADFWGYKQKNSEKNNRNKGISIVMTNTLKGEKMFNQIRGKLTYYERTVEDAAKVNWTLYTSFQAAEDRTEFWKDFYNHGFEYLMPRYLYPQRIDWRTKLKYKFGFNNQILMVIFSIGKWIKQVLRRIKKLVIG